ncbi:hypothetical protein FYK55_15910 [Roseiconus nitratireducens]|uniref:LTXXQ motif family protein n=1 Tax=Roseiconus nitratireducens TaxID=2605748 RepID=A0A5M6D4K6_9BACT|nr:hypothetical protein [Roseiconus nitratireducens]KAA5542283.1 hypothetical protein FYK55_15910 [Roseiconus nitratireducens]
MLRLIPAAAVLVVAFSATTSHAQVLPRVQRILSAINPPQTSGAYPRATVDTRRYESYRPSTDFHQHRGHGIDLRQLDRYSDQLAEVARHLHEDAHRLSPDYEHSQGIEAYVDRLDRLNAHMHDILHHAAGVGHLSSGEIRHLREDVNEVRRLAIRLDGELEHQRYDGARTQDFHALQHMRVIIAQEMFPLIRRMEYALDVHARPLHGHHDPHGSYYPRH